MIRVTKRRAAVIAVALVTVLLCGGWHHGWFVLTPRPWTRTTGWDRIPPALRPPPPASPDRGPTIHWLGHSGFLIEWHGARFLLDPNLNDWCTVVRRVMEKPRDAASMPPVDATLLSHAHCDHMDMSTLRALPDPGTIILPDGDEDYFDEEPWSRGHLRPLRVGEGTRVGGIEIFAVNTAHNGSRRHPWRSRKIAVGYILRGPDETLYFPGDTASTADFDGIRETYHPSLAILPIGCFSPRFPLKIHHLSPEDAVEAAAILGVHAAIPCHFGTFALTLDRTDTALPRFARAAHTQGLHWRMPQLLMPAEPASPLWNHGIMKYWNIGILE